MGSIDKLYFEYQSGSGKVAAMLHKASSFFCSIVYYDNSTAQLRRYEPISIVMILKLDSHREGRKEKRFFMADYNNG